MKTKKLELKKEVIAALNNDAMARVLGGDLVYGTEYACGDSAVPYSKKAECYSKNLADCSYSIKICDPKTGIKCVVKTEEESCFYPATFEATNCLIAQ